jgi:polyhydroxybutyrate depolymerase
MRILACAALLVPVGLGLLACSPDRVVQGRPYTLTIPDGASASTPLPLVVFLHGYTGNGVWDDRQLVELARHVNSKSFIYAQPNGTPNAEGKRFWNATDGCCAPAGSTVDDVGFLRAVVEDVNSQHPVDPARRYFFGYSNGGFMAARLACEASDLVTGVVSIAGSTWSDAARCGPGRPVALLHVHGTGDQTIHYEGSTSDAQPPSPIGRYPGAREMNARFGARNGCGKDVTAGDRLDLEKKLAGDETTSEHFDGCPPGGAVELWSMEGGGHFPSFQDDATARMLDWLLAHPR